MTLVQTIISLAHTLELEVVAEGVEEEPQAQQLRLVRCDQIQGYLVSKPVPFDEMTRLLHMSHERVAETPSDTEKVGGG
jgi:EAL domain-containing protein (putative c-di-GMP-specific phosphodiesterase class I)